MEFLVVLVLILVGAVLVLMEFLVFPGVNLVGLLGFLCIAAGIWSCYALYGAVAGHLVLLATACAGFLLTWYVLRSRTWRKLSLGARLEGGVEGVDGTVRVGDTGICLGRLAPMGEVRFGDAVVQAESLDGYVEEKSEVIAVQVLKNKVFVKLKTLKHDE